MTLIEITLCIVVVATVALAAYELSCLRLDLERALERVATLESAAAATAMHPRVSR